MTTDPGEIVNDLRTSVQVLIDLDRREATRAAAVLTRLLAGQDFATAAGLPVGWHKNLQDSARAAALEGLLALHGDDLDDSGIATLIVDGLARLASFPPDGRRPDHSEGHLVDLLRSGYVCGWRNWRRLAGAARGQRERRLATAALDVWLRSKPEGPEWHSSRKLNKLTPSKRSIATRRSSRQPRS